jgi:hypothetical protein
LENIVSEWVIYGLALIGAITVAAAVIVSSIYFVLHFSSSQKSLAHSPLANHSGESTMRQVNDRMHSFAETQVPPMRIHLEPTSQNPQLFGELGEQIAAWLIEQGFQCVGQFVIEELDYEQIAIFIGQDHRMIANMRLPDATGEPYAEFCFQDPTGDLCGVSNPPVSTVPLSNDAIGRLYHHQLSGDFGLIGRMYSEARSLAEVHQAVKLQPTLLAEVLEAAHAREMDLRMNAGGVSEQEIRVALARQGVAVSEEDVATIQNQWQAAIQGHLLDFSPRAMNYHIEGHRILVVHDGSLKNFLVDQLSGLIRCVSRSQDPVQRQVISAFAELPQLLSIFTPREAVARFRALLPRESRYRLVDQLKKPVEADLYVLPPDPSASLRRG